jgi:hypothetical protein
VYGRSRQDRESVSWWFPDWRAWEKTGSTVVPIAMLALQNVVIA